MKTELLKLTIYTNGYMFPYMASLFLKWQEKIQLQYFFFFNNNLQLYH